MSKTSQYSDDFKARAVRRVIDGEPASAVAKALGITATTLWRWKQDGFGNRVETSTPAATEAEQRRAALKDVALGADLTTVGASIGKSSSHVSQMVNSIGAYDLRQIVADVLAERDAHAARLRAEWHAALAELRGDLADLRGASDQKDARIAELKDALRVIGTTVLVAQIVAASEAQEAMGALNVRVSELVAKSVGAPAHENS